MESSNGNSSSLNLMDERKNKRKQSNRESARRSRMKKQKNLDDLADEVTSLTKKNGEIIHSMGLTTQRYMRLEAENSVLRAQLMELTQTLESLNDMIGFLCGPENENGGFEETIGFMGNFHLGVFNQPIMANADIFLHRPSYVFKL